MFDLDRFIEDCKEAIAEDASHKTVREVVARAVCDPAAVVATLGEPTRAGLERIYCSPELTILNIVWGPHMTLRPHTHEMWAVIGLYGGREDNIFWRHIEDESGRELEAAGAKSLFPRDAAPLGHDIIHSVTNPLPKLTGALHVYGGDFFAPGRKEWDPENLHEQPFDVDRALQEFEESNARLTSA